MLPTCNKFIESWKLKVQNIHVTMSKAYFYCYKCKDTKNPGYDLQAYTNEAQQIVRCINCSQLYYKIINVYAKDYIHYYFVSTKE